MVTVARSLILFFLLTIPAFALGANAEFQLGRSLSTHIYVDHTGTSTVPLTSSIEDLMSQYAFEPDRGPLNKGYSSSVYWVLLQLPELDVQQPWWLEYGYPLMDFIDVRFKQVDGGWKLVAKTGDQRAWDTRAMHSPLFYFSIPPNSTHALVRLESLGAMKVPFAVYSNTELEKVQFNEIFLHGLFFGALIIMIFYNLFVYFMSREDSYLFYVCLISAITLFEFAVTGYGTMYLWRDYPGWVNAHIQAISVGLCLTFVVLFTRRILNVGKLSKSLDWVLLILCLFSFSLSITGALLAAEWLVRATAILPIFVVLSIVYASGLALKRKQRGALVFLLAWGAGLVGAVLFSAQMQGWVPSNAITVNALKFGIILNVVLLSFSLVSQMRKLKQEKESFERAAKENYQLALVDALTGVPNRRAFDDRLKKEIERGRRDQTNIALMMIDIDYFKNFNDTYGHQMGDDTLVRTALIMRNCLRRPTDALFRYGGEEFSVILADTDEEGARNTAQRVMESIQGLCIPHSASPFKQVTVSIGLAVAKNANIDSEDFIQIADQSLYQAKRKGRNTLVMSDQRENPVVNIGDYFKNTPKDTL